MAEQVEGCQHMLAWLKPAAAEGRGSSGAILLRCAGCKDLFRGPAAFVVVVKAFQAESTATRREFYALAAKVKLALKDVAFLENTIRDPEKASGIMSRLEALEAQVGALNKRAQGPIKVKGPDRD